MPASVDEYFQSLLDLISASPFVRSSDISFDQRSPFVGFARGNIHFTDGSLLHLRELIDLEGAVTRIAYVYHCQRADGSLVFRYDNAAHYPDLPNAPHHKHDGSEAHVVSSAAPELSVVLKEIESLIPIE